MTVNGAIADKPSRQVLPGDALLVTGPGPRYVGRGGDKMQGALEAFALDVGGARCVDVGSSTGGFTDCLLQHGAVTVVAVDVGRAQLHERLLADDRVDVREQTDIRNVTLASLSGPADVGERRNVTAAAAGGADVIVCDVSFIGVERVLPKILELLDPAGVAVVLIKPQFEAGKQEASRGRGVIKDPDIWQRVLHEVVASTSAAGATAVAGCVSPIRGGQGNVEFFLLIRPGSGHASIDESQIITMVADAEALL